MISHAPTTTTGVHAPIHVRRLMLAAGLSLVAFIALSLTQMVNDDVVSVTGASGIGLLVVELFWLSAAAMGASFATLVFAARAAARGRDAGSGLGDWVGLLLGVMTGFVVVAVLPVEGLLATLGVGRPALAVLGAFLASTAFSIMSGARTPTLDDGGGSARAEP